MIKRWIKWWTTWDDEFGGDHVLEGPIVQRNKYLFVAFGISVILHQFIPGGDLWFHTHQASWGLRIILWGGYVEELWSWGDVTKATWRPGRFGIIRMNMCHRIASILNGRASYSLWIRPSTKFTVLRIRNGYPTLTVTPEEGLGVYTGEGWNNLRDEPYLWDWKFQPVESEL